MNGTDGKTIATDTVRDGKFVLKGVIAEPDIFQLGFVGYKEALDIFFFMILLVSLAILIIYLLQQLQGQQLKRIINNLRHLSILLRIVLII